MTKARAKRDRVEHMLAIAEQVETAVAKGGPADRELANIFRRNRCYGSHDRPFYSDSIFSLFRWRGWTGALADAGPIACLSATLMDAKEITPNIMTLARICGIDPEVLKPCRELTLEDRACYLKELMGMDRPPDWKELVPDWVWDDLAFGNDGQIRKWVESLQKPLPVWMRIMRGKEKDAIDMLHAEGIPVEKHPVITSALRSERNISREILEGNEAKLIAIQDLASQCLGYVASPQPGESWWDACSGSGGKTLHLADAMANQGFIFATDTRSALIRNLYARLRKSEIDIVKAAKLDAANAKPADAPFDGIVLDAPCSGTGTWARNPDARWRTHPGFVGERIELQQQLFANASRYLRPGGKLIYGVCSVLESESTAVVEHFLENNSDFRLQPFDNPLSGEECPGTLFVTPWEHDTIGMFIARLVK